MRSQNRTLRKGINKLDRLAFASVFAVFFTISDAAIAIQCRVSVNPINFGVYRPLTPVPVDVIGQFDVRCMAQPGSFSIIIGPGLSGDQLARTLSAGGSNLLNYNLYRDAARTQIWGDGTPPTFVVSGIRRNRGRPTFYNYPVYGRIFANQGPAPGVYNDNLIVTVLF